jgi:hypothetical protein
MSSSSLPPASAKAIRTTGSQAKFEFRAGDAELYRTATSVGHSTVGTRGNESSSLVVAARPSAGRSPARVRSALCQRKSCCPTAFSSGTLPVMKASAILLTRQLRVTVAAWVVARGLGSVVGQSNTKMSRCRSHHVYLGHERKGSGSKTAPNPSVEGMAKRLRLLSTPHLER